MSLTLHDFGFVRDLVKEQAGIALSEDKEYLVESRMLPLSREHGFPEISLFLAHVRNHPSEQFSKQIVEAMTTNETFFFRDTKPFDLLKNNVLPALMPSVGSKLRIWCAACSTGQEPYSIAMILKENPQLLGGKPVEILASDIDSVALKKAKDGIYNQFEVQRGLPIQYLMKYFQQNPERADSWQVKDELKSAIMFKEQNLIKDFSSLGLWDIIMCRNVLIYFDPETKKHILERMAKNMLPHAALFMGGAESPMGVTSLLKPYPDMPHGIFGKGG